VIAQKRWPICLVFCPSTSGFGFKLLRQKLGIFVTTGSPWICKTVESECSLRQLRSLKA
jgi:hypothetical protein